MVLMVLGFSRWRISSRSCRSHGKSWRYQKKPCPNLQQHIYSHQKSTLHELILDRTVCISSPLSTLPSSHPAYSLSSRRWKKIEVEVLAKCISDREAGGDFLSSLIQTFLSSPVINLPRSLSKKSKYKNEPCGSCVRMVNIVKPCYP